MTAAIPLSARWDLRLRTSRFRQARGWVLPLSAGLHLAVILLLVFGPSRKPPQEEMLSSPVALIFQPPKNSRMATPHPTQHAAVPAPAPSPPPAAPPAPRPAAPAPAPAPKPGAVAPAPAPVPQPAQLAPPVTPQSPAAVAAPQLPLPPPAVPLPRPEQKLAGLAPLRPVLPQTPPTPRRSTTFPAPMAYSLGTPLRTAPSARQAASASAGRAARGAPSFGNSVKVVSGHVDPSWFDMLHQWLQQHGYYPEQAALNNEDGTVVVQFVVNRYGRVLSVEKEMSSGSQWLDMATMGLLRGAHLPPLPPDSSDHTVTINLYYHYVLLP